jgi:hypothetical protein
MLSYVIYNDLYLKLINVDHKDVLASTHIWLLSKPTTLYGLSIKNSERQLLLLCWDYLVLTVWSSNSYRLSIRRLLLVCWDYEVLTVWSSNSYSLSICQLLLVCWDYKVLTVWSSNSDRLSESR